MLRISSGARLLGLMLFSVSLNAAHYNNTAG
jgi:hypothetical protein